MIFKYLHKQKEISKKRELIKVMIVSLNIPDKHKELYLESITILKEDGLDKLYKTLCNFIIELENEELENINKNNFKRISGINKKEIKEKQKELNSFSFLINNL